MNGVASYEARKREKQALRAARRIPARRMECRSRRAGCCPVPDTAQSPVVIPAVFLKQGVFPVRSPRDTPNSACEAIEELFGHAEEADEYKHLYCGVTPCSGPAARFLDFRRCTA